MRRIPVSLYFMWEWWEKYYHIHQPRPDFPGDDALDAMYLGRQRFLYAHFSAFGLGQSQPEMDGQYVNTVIRYGFDLIPVLLGVEIETIAAGGWQTRPVDEARAWEMRPVDLRNSPEYDWLCAEIARKRARYGSVSHCIDLGSAMNNAFRIRGQESYLDLLTEPELARHLFEVITETARSVYAFLREQFPPMDPVPISNCNVTMLSPATYEEHVLPFDAEQNRFCTSLTGAPPRAAVHHCDVPADTFFTAYRQLPGLASLQAAITSDVARFKALCPESAFSAMINPQFMQEDPAVLHTHLVRALLAGADDCCLWNIDPTLTPEAVGTLLRTVEQACAEVDCLPVFSVVPFCWDEIEWAFPRYQPATRAMR